jgi:hypothetical protein
MHDSGMDGTNKDDMVGGAQLYVLSCVYKVHAFSSVAPGVSCSLLWFGLSVLVSFSSALLYV